MFFQALHVIYVVIVVLLLFNLTIFIHELGHFWVGRRRGAKIERFAIWFGPAIWSKNINGVEFRLGCIPLGGYVAFPQLAMEAIEGKSETPSEELKPLKPRDKIPILVAGSVANIFLGFVVACIVWVVGLPEDSSNFDLKVGYIPANSPERAAGILPGDKIISINGKTVEDWDEITQKVALSLSEKIQVGVERDGERKTVEVIPNRDHLFKIRRLSIEYANQPVAGVVQPNSPAEKGGILPGDEFLVADGNKILGTMHLIELIHSKGNQPIHFVILRKGERIEKEVTPRIEKNSQKARIGVQLSPKMEDKLITVHPSPFKQITESLLMMADTLNALVHTKTTGVGVGDLSGPVGIGAILYKSIQLDFRLALKFLVILNINLAIVNLLPIPVLDGGHIVFSLIEAVRRKQLNPKFMEAIQTTFVALLLAFMIYITFNDVARLSKHWLIFSKTEEVKSSPLPAFEEKKTP